MEYAKLAKDMAGNLEHRRRLLKGCRTDLGLQRAVKEVCSRDLLFWVNAFLWTFDPRKIETGDDPNMPFITWVEYQDEALKTIEANIGRSDVGIDKSRDMGASWMCLVVFLHQWQFRPSRAFDLVSRKESLVDAPSNPDALFWKIDYMLERQPTFLLPAEWTRTKLALENRELNSTINGASTTADVGRGGRRTAILIDEYGAFEVPDSHAVNAATADNTRCRIFNSTYKGTTGAFYEQMQRTDIVKLRLHWSKHPEKNQGAYKDERGKWRSEWYNAQCKRIVTPALIAQELDIDPCGAASMFFPPELIDDLVRMEARPPIMRGRVMFDELDPMNAAKIGFLEDHAGPAMLWMVLKADMSIPAGDEFVVGADVSAGTGATNSVLSVACRRTREKVVEIARADLSPDKFAELAVAVCQWLGGAFLIWELNGPGGTFGKRVLDLGYRNIYFKQDEQGMAHALSKNLIPGWYASTSNKLQLFGEYVRALANRFYVNRSRDALQECRQYVYLPNGSIGNARAQAIADPSGARENHGDRPTADALANKALGAEPKVEKKEIGDPNDIPANPPMGSLAWRRQKAKDQETDQASEGWETKQEAIQGWQEVNLSGW